MIGTGHLHRHVRRARDGIACVGALLCAGFSAAFFGAAASQAQTATLVQRAGNPDAQVNIVIVGDGYTATDLPTFAAQTDAFLDLLWTLEPFKSHRDVFNVYRIDIVSNQSGVTKYVGGQLVTAVDTALDAELGCFSIDRLLCIDTNKANAAVAAAAPGVRADVRFALANSNEYGGGGGFWAAATAGHPFSGEVAIHEIGHSFGRLGDEYVDQTLCDRGIYGPPGEINATVANTRAEAPWSVWIDTATPIPTPGPQAAVPGLYAGGHYCPQYFRPTFNSIMRTLGQNFEQVSAEQLVKEMLRRTSPLAAASPIVFGADGGQTPSIALPRDGLSRFTAVLNVLPHLATGGGGPGPGDGPSGGLFGPTWRVDGVVAGQGSEFVFDAAQFGVGAHTVSVSSLYDTPLVRRDPEGLLTPARTWSVIVDAEPQSAARTASAVLPSARAVAVGQSATAFLTAVNTGSAAAAGCRPESAVAAPGAFVYQTTDPATNQLTGSPNTPADIAPGAAQTFVFGITPSSVSGASGVLPIVVRCSNAADSAIEPAVSGLYLEVGATAPPDLVAVAATPAAPGIVDLPADGSYSFFTVAAYNNGAAGSAVVRPTLGDHALPVMLDICETTGSADGGCLGALASQVTAEFAAGQVRTFTVFTRGKPPFGGNPYTAIPYDPAQYRVSVVFEAASGVQRFGATSVAVRTAPS